MACAVGPDFKRPEAPVAPQWRAKDDPRIATQAQTDSLWWKSFNDATLDQLVDLAYQQNLTLKIAWLRIVEARARLGYASGKQFPQVQAAFGSASAEGLTEYMADGLNLNRNFLDYQLGFDAVWEVDFWGKYRRGVEAESASLLASVADYYNALVSLTAEVARTYATLRTYEVLVDQARANVAVQEEGLRMAESRFRNGATSELDVTQATTLLESTRASIPDLEIGSQQSKNALCTSSRLPGATSTSRRVVRFSTRLRSGRRPIPMMPTAAASPSTNAFTAWVVEWVTRSMFSAPTCSASSATACTTPAATPPSAVCVVGTTTVATIDRPVISTATALVNVPPTSTPTRTRVMWQQLPRAAGPPHDGGPRGAV